MQSWVRRSPPFIGSKDAAQETFSGYLLHRFCAELLLTLPATHHEPTSCPNKGGPTWRHTNGNWRRIDVVALPLYWLSACSNAHTWQHGELAFRTGRITELRRWMFPFSFPVLVNVSTEISLPGERSGSQMLLSAQKLFGGLCLVGLSIGTLTGWKLLSPSWLASFLQLWLRLRGVQRWTGSRQILGRLLSSTETVDTMSLRGSGSENPFSCGFPYGLGALSPLAKLGRQGQTLLETVWSLRCKRAFCSLL